MHHHVASIGREVFDVSGAGDTVVAAMAAGLAAGMTRRDAAELANVAAGVVVGKLGTATATPGEIISLAGAPTPSRELKELVDDCKIWDDGGVRIGFANGCFDMLHSA